MESVCRLATRITEAFSNSHIISFLPSGNGDYKKPLVDLMIFLKDLFIWGFTCMRVCFHVCKHTLLYLVPNKVKERAIH